MTAAPQRRASAGFTLIEAVVVIVITGILGGIVAVFIKAPLQAYSDSVARAELSDIADTAVRRIGRDVRLALPNSVRVWNGDRTIGFLLTKTGGRYQAAEDGLASGTPLNFDNAGARSFTVLGGMPAGRQAILAGDFVVVYNLGPDQPPADAYTMGNAAAVTAVGGSTISLANNPFALQDPVMASPESRFQVVVGTVSYHCDLAAGTLTRFYSAGQIVAAQATPPAGAGALIATEVVGCAFNYTLLANTRSALVEIVLTLRRPGSGDGALTLTHQIHVDNTP